MSRGAVVGWAIVLFTIPLAPVLGSAASILASLLALFLVPGLFRQEARAALRHNPAPLVFIGVFVALGVTFVLTARTPRDPIYVFNFLSLPLAAGVFATALRVNRTDTLATLVALALAAVLGALVIAINDVVLRDRPLVYGLAMGPHVIARITLTFAFLALAGLLTLRSRWRFLGYLGLAAAVLVLLLSGTRGAFVALPPMAFVFVAFLLLDRRNRAQAFLLIALSIGAMAALMLLSDRFALLVGMAQQVLTTGVTEVGSGNHRLVMLEAAWQIFWQSPLIGHGWANFGAEAYPIAKSAVWGGPNDQLFQFHNDLANFAVAAGTVGIVCWLALLAAPILGALATQRDSLFRARLYICVQLSVSYFVFGLTDFTFGYDLPTTIYASLTAMVLGALRDGRPAERTAGA